MRKFKLNISYTYDKNFNRLTLTDPESILTKYVYDSLNRLTDITDLAHFDYDELSRRTGLSLANGTNTSYEYDLASRLTSLITTGPTKIKRFRPKNRFPHLLDELIIKNVFAASKTNIKSKKSTGSSNSINSINSYTYTYNSTGNRLTLTDLDGLHNYTYDNLYRLTGAIHPQLENPAESYNYDPVGNRNPAAYVYDSANRLLEDNEYTYEYDDNGNLINKTDRLTLETTTYTYDVENQLIRIDFPDATYAEYTYDGLGRRIEKNVNGVITRYVYDNEDILAEYDGSITLQAKYLHGLGIDEPLSMEREGQTYWYHSDGLGSITALTDNTGAVVRTYLYDSFGNIRAETGTITNPYTYTAREYDSESELYFYRRRYYDTKIGRFLQGDSTKYFIDIPKTLNLYIYALNNPINYSDPFGLYSVRQFLLDTATYSGIAMGGSLFVPGGQFASTVFAGISAAALGLEISLYSRRPYFDTLKEIIKMSLPIKKPYDMVPSHLIDSLGEKMASETEKIDRKFNKNK